jgi:cobalamin synthase
MFSSWILSPEVYKKGFKLSIGNWFTLFKQDWFYILLSLSPFLMTWRKWVSHVWRILHCLQAKDNLQQLLTSNSMNNDRYNYHLCYMVVFLLYIFHFQLLCICFSSLFYLLITIRYFRKYASVTRPLQTGDCIGLMNYLKMGYQFKSSPKRSQLCNY